MTDPSGTGDLSGRDPDEVVDEAEEESFPASDPPSYTPGHAGTPDHARDHQPQDGGR